MAIEILFYVLTVLIVYAVYKILYNPKKGVWKNQGIHEVSNNFLKDMFKMYTKPLHDVIDGMYQNHGRVFGTFQMQTPVLMVGDPDMLKTILVKDFNSFRDRADFTQFENKDEMVGNMLLFREGEEWKRVRSIISPTFTSGKMKRMAHLIEDCARSLMKNFDSNQNKKIDIKKFFGAYTMDVIARCAFGIKLDSLNDGNNPFVKYAGDAFKPRPNWKFFLFAILPKILWKNVEFRLFPKESSDFFSTVVRKIVAERNLEKNKVYDDFLKLLMEAAEKASEESNTSLSEIEIIANSFIFFVAGYETTTNALSYLAYNLAMNPEVQKTLQKEVDEAVNKLDDSNAYEIIMNLPYLEAVISETLRTHTNLIRIDRIAARDLTINNINIPKGTIIGIPTYSMHKDKEFYPEPEKFKPERFLSENKDQINPYTHLPFGIGPRNCVAMRFALMEVKYAMFNVLREFEFVATEETKAGLEFNCFSLLLQAKEVPLKVVRRKP